MQIAYHTSPESVELDAKRLARGFDLLREAVSSGYIPGCAAAIFRRGKSVCVGWGGTRNPRDPSEPVEAETIFLIASLTKPIVCAGALLLLEEGAFSLEQPVHRYIPEFSGSGKEKVKLIHLFTHTSGLHDQLPNSAVLRRSCAPIGDYVQAVCDTELLFAPGTHVSYQSMGILLIGEIVERLTGTRLRDFLRNRLFTPLGMTNTILGMPPNGMTRVAHSLDAPFPPESNDVGDDWNTGYWRDFGAPWGGLHSTVEDLSVFLSHMIGETVGPLSPALRAAMTTDQVADMSAMPEDERTANRWGLGWSLTAPAFGSLVSPATFGHLGATGAMFWADPDTRISCVLLTNQPRLWRDSPPEWDELAPRFSNIVAAAVRS
jgi:CubicO group peptidase (beta-lactamase class C family)